jgi:diketogulonate reductase-like aldo/keto reductase
MILKEPPVEKVAQSAGRSPAQVLIRWSIQNGVVTIPKSIKKERIKENCQVRNLYVEFHTGLIIIGDNVTYRSLTLN